MSKPTPLTPRHQGLLSMEEAASYLGIAVGTLRNWVSMRRIPYVKCGSLTKFRKADLDTWIDQHYVPAV